MQKIFRIRVRGVIVGFVSFGGNSRDRRKAARAHAKAHNDYYKGGFPVGDMSIQRVRGATSEVPVKFYVKGN